MEILRQGNPNAKKHKIKRFECDICGCVWEATDKEYKEDWTKHSIPIYCKCPCCGMEIYAIGTFKCGQSHIRGRE